MSPQSSPLRYVVGKHGVDHVAAAPIRSGRIPGSRGPCFPAHGVATAALVTATLVTKLKGPAMQRTVSVDTLVFMIVVVAAFIGLWADTVRTWLVW
jgi:hypothetical protein